MIRSMYRSAWLTVLVIFGFNLAYPQSNPQFQAKRASISGVVQDQAGAAIVGAQVELTAANRSPQSTTTDQSGSFQFKGIPPGEYQVQIKFEGFDRATVNVTLGARPAP